MINSGKSVRTALRLAAAAMIVCVALGYSRAGAEPTTKVVAKGETIRIMEYPGTIGVGQELLWVAKDKGFCEAHGLHCELVKIANGALGIQAITAGSLDFNLLTADFDMQAAARGVNMQLVAGTNPHLFLTLVVRKEVPLPNLSKGYPAVMHDLKGKKIGVAARGAATEVAMRALLNGAGMDPADVSFVPIGPPGPAYSAFVAGTVDAAMTWSPFPELCEVNKNCVAAVRLAQDGPAELKALNGAVEVLGAMRSYIEATKPNWSSLTERLEAAFLTRTRDEWCADPKAADACVCAVLSLHEAPVHPHNINRSTFFKEDGKYYPSPAPKFSNPFASLSGSTIGAEARPSLDLDAAGLESLKASGAVG